MNYCMCIILLIATVYDLKYRIIPNWLLCIGGIIGFLSPSITLMALKVKNAFIDVNGL